MMKRAKLSYDGQLDEAARFLRENDHFLVLAHVHPDGDALGSTFAMGHLLSSLNKTFELANEDELPQKYQYMQDTLTIKRTSSLSFIPKHIICLDCADFSRLGSIQEQIGADHMLLNIDHHPTNDYYGHVHLIKDDAAATAEIIYDLVEHMHVSWTRELAVAVYTGMLTDTGGFRYANTTSALLHKASQLLQFGVDSNQLADELLEKHSIEHIQLLKRSLQTLTLEEQNRIAWMTVTEKDIVATGAALDDLDGLINYPRNIVGVEIGVLFKQMDTSTVKISLRSNCDHVDVSMLASHWGGGGHKRAAGATIMGELNDVITTVITYTKQFIRHTK